MTDPTAPWSHVAHDPKLIDAALQRLRERPELLTPERREVMEDILTHP